MCLERKGYYSYLCCDVSLALLVAVDVVGVDIVGRRLSLRGEQLDARVIVRKHVQVPVLLLVVLIKSVRIGFHKQLTTNIVG